MPALGEQYKHNAVKDVVYAVTEVNSDLKFVALTDTVTGRNVRPIRVSFADLKKNYRKV